MQQILPKMGQAGLCCPHPAAPHDTLRAAPAEGQQDHQDQGTQQPQPSPCLWHCVPQRYPAFARLSPGVETSHLREGLRAGCRCGGPLAAPEAPAALPQPWGCAQKSSLVPKNLSGESCTAVLSVTRSPATNWQLFRQVIWRQKFSSKRKI